jgi:uncharacterized membrane protein YoaK (UPF0700 family)
MTAPPAPSDVVTREHLVPLLVALTVTTGLIDAVSYVGLGHVFTANMTGNVVFIGFALAGAEGVSVGRSLVALVAFAGGALVAARLLTAGAGNAVRQLAMASASEAALLLIAAGVALGGTASLRPSTTYALIVLTAVAMGLRSAVVRKLGIPDVTTIVLTMTITGLAAEFSLAGADDGRRRRRVLSVVGLLAGACIGTLLLRQWNLAAPLTVAASVAAGVAAYAGRWTLVRVAA